MGLVLEAQAGNREAFATLVERFQGRLYAQALGILADPTEAEEAAQETIVRAFERIRNLREPSAFSTWLGRITATVSADRLRGRKPSAATDGPAAPGRDPVEADEDSRALWRAVRELQPDYRTAFLLVHLEDLSYREVAEQLDVPLSTVEGRVYMAKKLLRERISR